MRRWLGLLGACLLIHGCSGGGGGGGGSTAATAPAATSTPAPLTNFTTITVDTGPAALSVGANGYIADNTPFVSVTLCAPGTSNCQTIDHIILDTGSVGLRVLASVLNSSVLSALPTQTDASANPVGECYGYVDGYVFGSVRSADFQVGGESVSGLPVNVISDTGAFTQVPASCSAGGGSNLDTVQAFGGNGVLGVGLTTTDCGTVCTSAGGYGAATYYDCPASGCSAVIARAAATTAPFQQLVNPVAAMTTDNNGTIINLPAVSAAGQASASGTLYFGIGTQTNNGLGSATVLTTTTSSSRSGAGLLTVAYNGKNLTNSFLDSGSNAYFFVNSAIPACTGSDYTGYYCPPSPLTLSVTVQGQNGSSAAQSLTLNNAMTLLSTSNAVAPGIGVNPNLVGQLNGYTSSFDIGFPFFYGRNVYTAIEGRSAGGATGPYFAF